MNFSINDIITRYEYNSEKSSYLNNFKIVDVLFRKSTGFTIIKAENDTVLPYSIYTDIINYFKECGINDLKLYLKARKQDLPLKEINLYLDEFRSINNGFKTCVPLADDNGFILSYDNQNDYQEDEKSLDELKLL